MKCMDIKQTDDRMDGGMNDKGIDEKRIDDKGMYDQMVMILTMH